MPQNQRGALQVAEKFLESVSEGRFVSGRDFSRAVRAAKLMGPLGPEGCFSGARAKSGHFSAPCLALEGMLGAEENLFRGSLGKVQNHALKNMVKYNLKEARQKPTHPQRSITF
jgi:hypothetical protein